MSHNIDTIQTPHNAPRPRENPARRRPPTLSRGRLRRQEQARRWRQQRMRRVGYGATALIASGLVALAVALPSGTSTSKTAMGSSGSNGPALGATAPAFSLTDVVSNKQVTLRSLAGHKTLLFFSEGVGCQACMVQAADLQTTKALSDAGVSLVSISTDPPGQLADAARQYGIHTPMLADSATTMSTAYGMLGHGGMQHPSQDGHAFMLLDANGDVVWHHAYPSIYVNPNQLLADKT
jgi:peroxiredoxin